MSTFTVPEALKLSGLNRNQLNYLEADGLVVPRRKRRKNGRSDIITYTLIQVYQLRVYALYKQRCIIVPVGLLEEIEMNFDKLHTHRLVIVDGSFGWFAPDLSDLWSFFGDRYIIWGDFTILPLLADDLMRRGLGELLEAG